MEFLSTHAMALWVAIPCVVLLWLISIPLRNVSIIDLFWGPGFALIASYFAWYLGDLTDPRTLIVLILVWIWALRLFLYLAFRNIGHGEDPRYAAFRKDFGGKGYWWYSLPSVFILQAILMWIISTPLLGGQLPNQDGKFQALNLLDAIAGFLWLVGFLFESIGDAQLAKFKRLPENKAKLLTTGLWKYTRHPNYFGDATLWWGFGLFSAAAGHYWPLLSSLFMTVLIIKVSGVSLLEKSLQKAKPGYESYVKKTSAFFPWLPKDVSK